MAQLFLNQSKYHPLYSTGEQMKVAKKKKGLFTGHYRLHQNEDIGL